MRHFELIDSGIDVALIVAQLSAHPELWGQQAERLGVGSPHVETTDIWVRFRDVEAYRANHGADMSKFCDEHESIWLSPAQDLPAAVHLAEKIAGERPLGGVLITKVPAGGKIAPHIDSGWHAAAHDKNYVALQVKPGMRFCWEDGAIEAKDGDVYAFRNDVLHWVDNPTDTDRLSMIVCVRREQ